MSDDSDFPNKSGKRRKRPLKPASSSESSDSDIPLVNSKRSRTRLIPVLESENDSSDSEKEESLGIRGARKCATKKILTHCDTEDINIEDDSAFSDTSGSSSDPEHDLTDQPQTKKMETLDSDSSSDSDGQSEKCPICLVKFSSQEVGTPEACDHCFCAVCIEEWAKNVNTCPVDRQPFTLILVRQHLEGKVVRQIPVSVPSKNEVVLEDATFCEVCGCSDREDRMLLCDTCDHGYHMECLDPPLDHVPVDEWHCPECALLHHSMRRQGRRTQGRHREEANNDVDYDIDISTSHLRHNSTPRMLPRTRQSERVQMNLRNLITSNVNNVRFGDQPSTSSGVESLEDSSRVRTQIRPRPRPRRNRSRKKKSRIRIKKIITDDGVIEVRLRKRKYAKKRKSRKSHTAKREPHTVKGRLANRLGMCVSRISRQLIPETVNRQELTNTPLNHQRHQAGVPTLDIFGRRDQLDYFSGSENEDSAEIMEGGIGVLARAQVSRPTDRFIRRKKAASILSSASLRKPLKVEKIELPANGSLLDSILDSQTLWHSKKTEIKSNSDGSLQVLLPRNSRDGVLKEDKKVDVKNNSAPVTETPLFPGGRVNSGTYKPDSSSKGGNNQGRNTTNQEQSYEGGSYQSSSSAEPGYSRCDSSVRGGLAPLRGTGPIRFRMNIPPRRPNIHSYPSDNIPPPPPLRLRPSLTETTFPTTNSPEASPAREEEEIDIYSDIEQENNLNDTDEKAFGVLEPPPEPPFLMTLEPPPEPPALLMNLNDDASDDEPSGLVIDDLHVGDVYDPCDMNSDDSAAEDPPLTKPPELPKSLKDRELVADYSSDSNNYTAETSPYNPELPTYFNTPIVGPLPQPPSCNSSEAEDDDKDCPNFSMYSAESLNLAHRDLPGSINTSDIPIPPPIEEKPPLEDFDIPLPDDLSPDIKEKNLNIAEEQLNHSFESVDNISNDAISDNEDRSNSMKDTTESVAELNNETDVITEEEPEEKTDDQDDEKSVDDQDDEESVDDQDIEKTIDEQDIEKNDDQANEKNVDDQDDEKNGFVEEKADDDEPAVDDDETNIVQDCNESDGDNSIQETVEKTVKTKNIKVKGSSEAGEDECSTQGDVLDLAIESEANLENNIAHDESEEQRETCLVRSPEELGESDEKGVDGGDKSDGLVDITDEEMSVYDGQDNREDVEKLNIEELKSGQSEKTISKSLYSDDDNSLVGGATSAISAGTLNNSDNIQPPTLPGLEGLETETISESEDVNFDELPLESHEQLEVLRNEEDLGSSRKKKKKKNRKVSHTEDSIGKGNNESLEFEEGEIIEDKPKQLPKKEKKTKPKPDNEIDKDEHIDTNKSKIMSVEKDTVEKKTKKKKDKGSIPKDKNDKTREFKEKTVKLVHVDENVAWKKLSKSSKERNYRDGKEKEERDRENKGESLSKKEKRNKEKRKELERYDVRRLISEKPKRPKKDEFGRDISPSKSGSSLSPYRPPRYRSPLRTKNRSRTRSRSWRSSSRSKGKRRRIKSRERIRSRDRAKRSRSRNRRMSRSRNKLVSRSHERRKSVDKNKTNNRSVSRSRRKSRSPSVLHTKKHRSLSYSRSWTPSWSKSSLSRSQSPRGKRKSKSPSRSRSGSWTRDKNASGRGIRKKVPPKNLTVIVTNKDALKKKEKKKLSKKKDDRRKKKRGQSPAPSKEVFTSGDNILVSVNFKNANKNPELIPASTPLLRESSKRKRDDVDSSAKKKKLNSTSKKTPVPKKSNRLARINEVTRNAKPVAIIDLDLSPFRLQTPSPKEVIILSDSGDEGDKEHNELQEELNRMGNNSINQSMLSLSSIDHGQKNSLSQPGSPISPSFIMNSSGPKTPPEPHIKFSITTKPAQIRMLSNPLMEAEEEMQDEIIDENEVDEILHKGPNTPPEPPPDLNTPASPPTTPYDPFDPTKSRSPSPQPRNMDAPVPIILREITREDKLEINHRIPIIENDDDEDDDDNHHLSLTEPRSLSPLDEPEDVNKSPELIKVHSTPKTDLTNADISPKVSPLTGLSEPNKLPEDTLMKPIQKLLASAGTLEVTVHKSPEKLINVISQQVKNVNQTPKQPIQPLKVITPIKHQTPKGNIKHQLFSSSLVKQVPILGTLPLLPGPPMYTSSISLNSTSKSGGRIQQNGDPSDDMDIDPSSPYSPGSSEADDLFEPPIATPPRNSSKAITSKPKLASGSKFDALFGSSPAKPRHGRHSSKAVKRGTRAKSKGKKEEIKVKLDEDQLKILDDLPSSAVEMQFLKKLNRQERVVEEVKLVLKPHYAKKHINKEEYKEILRRSVPKICHNKSGEINPIKIQFLVEAYVKKFRYTKKKAAGGSTSLQSKVKPQKTLWS